MFNQPFSSRGNTLQTIFVFEKRNSSQVCLQSLFLKREVIRFVIKTITAARDEEINRLWSPVRTLLWRRNSKTMLFSSKFVSEWRVYFYILFSKIWKDNFMCYWEDIQIWNKYLFDIQYDFKDMFDIHQEQNKET